MQNLKLIEMKKIFFLIFFLNLNSFLFSQEEQIQHETIAKLNVMYTDAQGAEDTITYVNVKLEVLFRTDALINFIQYEIINENGVLISSAEYFLNTDVVNDELNNVVFSKINNGVVMFSARKIPLKPYIIKLRTKDIQGNFSSDYSNTY